MVLNERHARQQLIKERSEIRKLVEEIYEQEKQK